MKEPRMLKNRRNEVLLGIACLFFMHPFWVHAQCPKLKSAAGREHFERARLYDASNDPRAENEYRQAITECGGVYAEVWQELSDYLARHQRFDEAKNAWRKYLEQAREKADRNPIRLSRMQRGAELKSSIDAGDPLSADEMVELVNIVHGFGSKDDAIPYAEKALKLHPKSATVLIALAELIRWKDKERSLSLLHRAVTFEPNNPSMYLARGWNYYWAQGKPTEAEVDFRKAIELSNGSKASAWAGLGDALAAQGRRDEAIAAYRTYLSNRREADSHHDREVEKSIEQLQKSP